MIKVIIQDENDFIGEPTIIGVSSLFSMKASCQSHMTPYGLTKH